MKITENELGKTVEFQYSKDLGKTWERKNGCVAIASAEHGTFLLGTIIYFTDQINHHLKDIKILK